jgi:hypothetical protein
LKATEIYKICSFQISPIRISTCNLHGQKVKSGITAYLPTVLIRHFVSTSGHYSHSAFNSHSNTNTTGSSRSAKPPNHATAKNDDKKDDLNLLFKKDETSASAIRNKKESDYGIHAGLHRKESKEKEDAGNHHRRSRENDFHHRKDYDIYASIHSKTKEVETNDPWLEVGCASFGPIIMEAASALPIPEHCLHLVQHK